MTKKNGHFLRYFNLLTVFIVTTISNDMNHL